MMVRKIPLTQGRVALVDDADYAAVAVHRWFAAKWGRGFCAMRQVRGARGGRRRQVSIYMHRQILGQGYGCPDAVRHINGDGLDNRRENLVVRWRSSTYRGVSWHKTGRWVASITRRGQRMHLGYYKDEAAAAAACAERRKQLSEADDGAKTKAENIAQARKRRQGRTRRKPG
ncbi:MAG TPA: AP2 domain-containing protein [Dissulfurispiraceae bacterium]|nr:AP2 domain-containing protein [Dissulfurispiraceae bacterium]